jgi:hypothetical protein
VTFNPERASIRWQSDWQRVLFDFAADKSYAGSALNGEIMIYSGPLVIGAIRLAFLCDETISTSSVADTIALTSDPFRRIFASYSHADGAVVTACRNRYKALGLDVLIDVDTLRSGQRWSEQLCRMVDQSDVFQLFWSARSAESEFVQQEWRYALGLGRSNDFIRPVYWEQPLPAPPEELQPLHFAFMPLAQLTAPLAEPLFPPDDAPMDEARLQAERQRFLQAGYTLHETKALVEDGSRRSTRGYEFTLTAQADGTIVIFDLLPGYPAATPVIWVKRPGEARTSQYRGQSARATGPCPPG